MSASLHIINVGIKDQQSYRYNLQRVAALSRGGSQYSKFFL